MQPSDIKLSDETTLEHIALMNFLARHLCDEQLLLGQLSARRLWKALSSILFVDQMHAQD